MSNIFWACKSGDLNNLKAIVQTGVSVNVRDDNGCTALYCSAFYNHPECVRFLLQQKSDINGRNGETRTTALFGATDQHHISIMKLLLLEGADANIPNIKGQTALWKAADMGHKDSLEVLVSHFADVNIADEMGISPLYTAAFRGFHECVHCLLQNHADVNQCENGGFSPLYAATQNGHVKTVHHLIDAKALIEKRGTYGYTALLLACQKNMMDITKLLCEAQADVNAQTVSGDTGLHWAVQNNNIDMVKCLLFHNGRQKKNKSGSTPMDIAKHKGFREIVMLLGNYEKECNPLLTSHASVHTMHNNTKDLKNFDRNTKGSIVEVPSIDKVLAIGEGEVLKKLSNLEVERQGATATKVTKANDLSDNHLLKLAQKLGGKWKTMGAVLKISHSQIVALARENEDDSTFAAWSMLLMWRDGLAASVETKRQMLQEACVEINRQDLYDVI